MTLEAGESKWISLSESFKGCVQRGTQLPVTWAEFQVSAPDGKAWDDINLEQGCDGAATIKPTDGGTAVGGFEEDAISKLTLAGLAIHSPKKCCQSSGPNMRVGIFRPET